ncbi:sensor histidine kinase [Chengkuizengella axinellae]|uniref:histidine kinase n=1 Tax=Chengkuizengella axinellae TaxID=3064388 RepID=A0ABT9ITN0_9BACL|nr:HAMP domain-containing sensor histidine kinase [Chengkuizengella sp. 2205SS18-9]MDP5272710.1 HAMP domain-containing sensor histidine kinase [Chengkuizengella sp. 2205SS18-9]
MSGIKKRIVTHYILVIFLTIALLEGIFLTFIHFYYYDGVEKILKNHAQVSSSYANRYMSLNSYNLDDSLQLIKDQFSYEGAELQVLDGQGRVLLTSSGIGLDEVIKTDDVMQALNGVETSWRGDHFLTNESVVAVSTPLFEAEQPFAVLRFITSLENVNQTVYNIYAVSIGIGLIILFIIFLVSITLAKSIAKPINELTLASEKIAKGNFQSKIKETYIDEIGTLAKTFNTMADELTKNEKMKNEFISSISHEIRTPLTSIKGWSETISSGDLSDKQETMEGLHTIQDETERLIGLVEELLDFSRYQANSLTLNEKPFNLTALFKDVIFQMKTKTKDKHMKIRFHFDQDLLMIGDKNRLKQVLINLLDNAIKYSLEETTIIIEIEENEQNVKFHIRDEGVGIDPSELPSVTKMFYQVDANQSGTGLGLAICQKIIELHQGSLHIESKKNEGTTVTVSLPKK